MSITPSVTIVSAVSETDSLHEHSELRSLSDIDDPATLVSKVRIKNDVKRVEAGVERDDGHVIRTILNPA
jgi:hypothetical protein